MEFSTILPHLLSVKYADPNLPETEPPEYRYNIENISEHFDDLVEEFLDEVFEFESKLSRKEWEKDCAKKQSYIFFPSKVREKLKTKIEMNFSYTSRRSARKK
jgi:hypothetical protein